ncbi:MAG TPA: glutamate-5-semialdehyde dehydrogenase [Chloroflexota bacterium]|nr:glutamate-5-semialdehyde dehydrogenase [Chloroflexota bacterium]
MLEVSTLTEYAERARHAARSLSHCSSEVKSAILRDLADRLTDQQDRILAANAGDLADARRVGMDEALVDRLLLSEPRLEAMAADVRRVAELPDPVGEELDERVLPNRLVVKRRRVPLGVIAVVYESRPNVTIDVSALCIRSGNAVILRPGKESRRSSTALAELARLALAAHGAPADGVQLIHDPDRALVADLVRMRGQIDLVVPRGGAGLIEFVRDHAQVPVVAGGIGVCHTYVHADADPAMALEIVHNAKTRRPSVCNALDTVLVHRQIAPAFLPRLAARWREVPVEMRCCPDALRLLEAQVGPGPWIAATPDDFGREFLALRAAVKIVDSMQEAIDHIERYGSGHSEAIVTESGDAGREFLERVDAAAVYVNASTGFTDGAQFGLGAELGISTQKLHARGPIGLRELTSYKWVIEGTGQIRE